VSKASLKVTFLGSHFTSLWCKGRISRFSSTVKLTFYQFQKKAHGIGLGMIFGLGVFDTLHDQSTCLPSVSMMGQFSAEAHHTTMLDAIQWRHGKRGAVGKNRIGLVEVMKHKDGKQPFISIQNKGKTRVDT
jgi:hypothetical protein